MPLTEEQEKQDLKTKIASIYIAKRDWLSAFKHQYNLLDRTIEELGADTISERLEGESLPKLREYYRKLNAKIRLSNQVIFDIKSEPSKEEMAIGDIQSRIEAIEGIQPFLIQCTELIVGRGKDLTWVKDILNFFGILSPDPQNLSKNKGSKFFEGMKGNIRKIAQIFDPNLPPTETEKKQSGEKCRELFEKAAKIDVRVNAFYRSLLTKTYSDEQKVNGLLKYTKALMTSKIPNSKKLAHQLLSKIEEYLLPGGYQASVAGEIRGNLRSAYKIANKSASIPMEIEEQFKLAEKTIKDLIRGIKNKQWQIGRGNYSKPEKLGLYLTTFDNKRKLLQFLLKTKAMACGETLSPKKHFTLSKEYMDSLLVTLPKVNARDIIEETLPTKGIFKLFEIKRSGKGIVLASEEKFGQKIREILEQRAVLATV